MIEMPMCLVVTIVEYIGLCPSKHVLHEPRFVKKIYFVSTSLIIAVSSLELEKNHIAINRLACWLFLVSMALSILLLTAFYITTWQGF